MPEDKVELVGVEDEIDTLIDEMDDGSTEDPLEDNRFDNDFLDEKEEEEPRKEAVKEEEPKKEEKGPPQTDEKRGFRDRETRRQESERLTNENTQLKQELQRVQGEVQKFRGEAERIIADVQKENLAALNGAPAKLGMNAEEAGEALSFYAGWQKEPLTVMKDIIARTVNRGYTLQQIIGQDFKESVEMEALRQMIGEQLSPVTEQVAERQQANEARQQAQQQFEAFVQSYPLARVHGKAIAHLVNTEKMSAEAAYRELERFAQQEGLDMRQELGGQIAQRNGRGQQLSNQNGRGGAVVPQQRRQRPLPNGSASPQAEPRHTTAQAGPDDEWGDIVDNVMSR